MLTKTKKIDLSTTNLALFGTDVEKKLNKLLLPMRRPGVKLERPQALRSGELRISKLYQFPRLLTVNSSMVTLTSSLRQTK